MNLKHAVLLLVIFVSSSFVASAVPDNKPVKKDSVSTTAVSSELKSSLKFNFGVPLPNKTLTAPRVNDKNELNDWGQYSWLQKKYAEKMEVHPSDIQNEKLYTFINSWYGTKYVYGGTTRKGIDCSSFVQKLTEANSNKSLQRTAASQKSGSSFVNKDELQEGDLVFFKIKVNRISHVGVYLQNGYFVHASSSRGVMISNLNSSYWSRYYAGGGRTN